MLSGPTLPLPPPIVKDVRVSVENRFTQKFSIYTILLSTFFSDQIYSNWRVFFLSLASAEAHGGFRFSVTLFSLLGTP